ncbi:acylphosphatase [Candidatus Micrarchaeota archaeon]|nr:acylphosphatase [Candidatus Micrarchaeota archaeon]
MFQVIIQGRVQGVGFRWLVENIAKRLNINGYVKNLSDGSVEIMCDCDKNKLDIFLNEIEKNISAPVRIDNIIINNVSSDKRFDGFTIRF